MTLKIGMLWFDNDPKADLKKKIERAVQYYEKKYYQTPNLVFVHPSTNLNGGGKLPDIEIRTNRSVLPDHFWIGVGED